ncbi:MAG: hypothetical protein LQ344_006077 [Seirophora lacunosa]|nr:MAG: hypothetical protein LQ344_006077 [Seirophora lacunosa]
MLSYRPGFLALRVKGFETRDERNPDELLTTSDPPHSAAEHAQRDRIKVLEAQNTRLREDLAEARRETQTDADESDRIEWKYAQGREKVQILISEAVKEAEEENLGANRGYKRRCSSRMEVTEQEAAPLEMHFRGDNLG